MSHAAIGVGSTVNSVLDAYGDRAREHHIYGERSTPKVTQRPMGAQAFAASRTIRA